jgi:hypothetical protein
MLHIIFTISRAGPLISALTRSMSSTLKLDLFQSQHNDKQRRVLWRLERGEDAVGQHLGDNFTEGHNHSVTLAVLFENIQHLARNCAEQPHLLLILELLQIFQQKVALLQDLRVRVRVMLCIPETE